MLSASVYPFEFAISDFRTLSSLYLFLLVAHPTSLDHSVRSHQHVRRNRHADLSDHFRLMMSSNFVGCSTGRSAHRLSKDAGIAIDRSTRFLLGGVPVAVSDFFLRTALSYRQLGKAVTNTAPSPREYCFDNCFSVTCPNSQARRYQPSR